MRRDSAVGRRAGRVVSGVGSWRGGGERKGSERGRARRMGGKRAESWEWICRMKTTLLSLTVCICDVNRPTKGSSD